MSMDNYMRPINGSRGFYQYAASYRIYNLDQTEEIKISSLDSNIPLYVLYFWDRERLRSECRKWMIEKVLRDERIFKCEILEDRLIRLRE